MARCLNYIAPFSCTQPKYVVKYNNYVPTYTVFKSIPINNACKLRLVVTVNNNRPQSTYSHPPLTAGRTLLWFSGKGNLRLSTTEQKYSLLLYVKNTIAYLGVRNKNERTMVQTGLWPNRQGSSISLFRSLMQKNPIRITLVFFSLQEIIVCRCSCESNNLCPADHRWNVSAGPV